MIAKKFSFLNIDFLCSFECFPSAIQKLKNRCLKKFKNKFFLNQKFDIKQKRISES